jgi:two-component system, cell cycle sensor histidine kinase and response regulator CckA
VQAGRYRAALRGAADAAVTHERALRERDARFRTTFDLTPDAITLSRVRDGRYVAANEGFTRLTGWTEAEMTGHTAIERGIWVVPEQRAKLAALLVAGKPVNDAECTFGRKDGTTLTGLLSARTLTLDGELYLVSFTRDVTGRKLAEAERAQLQDQLRQAQKLEAVGQLAGGVAHDFNNVLTSILACAEFVRDALEPQHRAAADVDQIRQDALRGAELTKQLLTFARRQLVEPRVTRIADRARRQLVEPRVTRIADRAHAMEAMIRRLVHDGVTVTTRWADDGWTVFVDPSQLEQVILNLVVNARDAMPHGGRLELATHALGLDADAAAALGLTPGDYVRLSARDEGVGMEPDVLGHIFEPFFTTKAGRGFGLGLATCYGIVRQAGGAITVTSKPGQGSRFDVYLPRTTGPVIAADGATPVTNHHGDETVLVVEDEPSVRRLAVRALTAVGYRVLEADSCATAAQVVGAHAGELHAAVVDVALPDGNGREVAEMLARDRPHTRLLFVSGYVGDLVGPTGELEPGVTFLPKPYTPEQLAGKVRQVLDQAAGPVTGSSRAARTPA